ncbi:hypothetical protein [Psychrobacter sp. DM4]|uniref:hypothetical protein n=1 Tax=Psychrobacter sp. DM4 TaxID=3440637 RepID=UPI003F4FFE6D
MKYGDVFQKSEIGRDEIKNHSIGVLPREARTLLIMIDGKRTYQNYLDTLNQSKMFASFGGVTPLFELLLEFDCIEVIGSSKSPSSSTPRVSRPSSITKPTIQNSEAEFERTFNSQKLDEVASIGNPPKSKLPDANYEILKSELATYIEKNAPPQEAWGYLLNLEQCDNTAQLLALAQSIQESSSDKLSGGMDSFIKKMRQ